jgi:ABC-2 type transport system ATP-binding protein
MFPSAVDPVITAESLIKRFGDIAALDGVDFAVSAGSITALLGGNGAGKTTTIAILLGLLLPTGGRVRVLGADMARERQRVLGRMNFSSPYVDLPRRLSVAENLKVYARLYGLDRVGRRIERLAADLGIEAFLDRPTGALSAGERTRVALAKALLNDPAVLLLDEPTASLDPDTGDFVRSYLAAFQKRTGATILLASHNMVEVERLADHVLIMKAGRIVDQGAPGALIQRYGRRTMEEVFLDIARSRPAGAGSALRVATS